MRSNIFGALALFIALGIAPTAFAAGLEGFEYLPGQDHKVTLKSGKVVTVMVGKMDGKMMAVIPMEDMHDLFFRAEGHSMTTSP